MPYYSQTRDLGGFVTRLVYNYVHFYIHALTWSGVVEQSSTMKSIPIHLLVEAQEHVVSVELSSGEVYRGRLVQSDDNMNLHLSDVLATAKDGVKSQLPAAFVRGSHVKMIILPEMLQFAPALRTDVALKASNSIKQQHKHKKPPRKQLKVA